MNDEIKDIAKKVHRWALRHREKFTGWKSSDLNGMCAIASWELFKRLKNVGYKPIVCANGGHFFIKLNKYLIDITSKQFDEKAITIMPISKANKWWWEIEERITNERGLRKVQRDWDNSQKHPDIRADNDIN